MQLLQLLRLHSRHFSPARALICLRKRHHAARNGQRFACNPPGLRDTDIYQACSGQNHLGNGCADCLRDGILRLGEGLQSSTHSFCQPCATTKAAMQASEGQLEKVRHLVGRTKIAATLAEAYSLADPERALRSNVMMMLPAHWQWPHSPLGLHNGEQRFPSPIKWHHPAPLIQGSKKQKCNSCQQARASPPVETASALAIAFVLPLIAASSSLHAPTCPPKSVHKHFYCGNRSIVAAHIANRQLMAGSHAILCPARG